MTQIGAVVAKKVALATLVCRIAECQNSRSPAKARPASNVGQREPPPRRGCAPSSRIHSHSSGSASATRQKALANGPTSAQRTKIGDMPIAMAPTDERAKGSRAAGGGERRGFRHSQIP